MKYILSGTNRIGSRSLQVAKILQQIFTDHGEHVEIMDLCQVGLSEMAGMEYSENLPPAMRAAVDKINLAEGVVFVCPEYNGSIPGALKYFVDHWKYPESFEFRPVSFVGLGGRFGGLRGVEHLQLIMGFRNAFIYPERVFLHDVWTILKDGGITDANMMGLLKKQVLGFQKFTRALQVAGLDANSRRNQVP